MGSADLFRKRKAQSAEALRRKAGRRMPRARYLIVCEGSETEPNYLEGLRRAERLLTAEVVIYGKECGSDPLSVIDYAVRRYRELAESSDVDAVFCVIDRDSHANFNQAMSRVNDLFRGQVPIHAIVSFPSFEYWVLLHFAYARSPYAKRGKRSPGAVVLAEVKRHHPRYAKGDSDLYETLKERLETAISNAQRAEADAKETGEPNPSTSMHLLVQRLLAQNG